MLQVKSKKMEIKFGMSPLKTQQFSSDLIKTEKKKKDNHKKEDDKNKFGSISQRWSFRLPKFNNQKSKRNGHEELAVTNSKLSDRSNTSRLDLDKKSEKAEDLQKPPKTKLVRSVSNLNQPPWVPKTKYERDNYVVQVNLQRLPKTPLKRSVSDVKQKPRVHKNILQSSELKEVYNSPMFSYPVPDYFKKQDDQVNEKNNLNKEVRGVRERVKPLNRASVWEEKETNKDLSDDKENMIVNVIEESGKCDPSKHYGSILKRPGKKRTNIKHVEFLDNIGNDQERIRYF